MIYLYIKIHNKTGLKYFGKTTRKNPEKYIGSGKHWKAHVKKHGNDVTTTILGVYHDIQECQEIALRFSQENNIINSNEWANLIDENGLDGAPKGHKGHIFTKEQLEKMSKKSKEKWSNPEYKEKMKQIHKNRWNDKEREKQSIRLKNEFWTKERKKQHSEKLKGHIGSKKLKGVPKTIEHNRKNSAALKGKKKTSEHILKLKQPKNRICRLTDKKEMSVNHFTRWIKTLTPLS